MTLVCLGNTIIDVTVAVGAFPDHGGDVLATSGALHAGGSGFNVMCAARRLGVTSVYAGMHGTGPFGDVARTALSREGIELVHDPTPDDDTGWDIAITDASAERTFITVVGAESRLTMSHLARVSVNTGDVVYISGYGLLAEPNRSAICDWLATIPTGVVVVTDPGPLLADIPQDALDRVLAHTTWWSSNEREAAALSGESEATVAAAHIAARLRQNSDGGPNNGAGPNRGSMSGGSMSGGGVILRQGAAGCLVVESGREPHSVPGVMVDAVDTNGAGDAHVGAFIASLCAGMDPLASALRANAAAAYSVTRAGPATSPTTRELDQFLRRER